MSELNPYEHFLDGRPVQIILGSTAARLALLVEAIGAEKAYAAPGPGKWSAADIVCHMADCEIVFAFRLRQTLAEYAPAVQPFDQEKWATTYRGIPIGQALEVFSALRAWNMLLIGKALPQAGNRLVHHPERGLMTFNTLVETIAGHDLSHLRHVQKLAQAARG
jgi:hypothetical protein